MRRSPVVANWFVQKAGWREIGGMKKYYRSKMEANYARYLEWLKTIGEIAVWKHETITFWFHGIKRGVMSYLPDFEVHYKDGSMEYHEVKGYLDSKSKTKLKRMAKYYPHLKVILIGSKEYRAIERTAKGIAGWE